MINFGGGGANKANWVLMITVGLSISDISTRSQICFFVGGGWEQPRIWSHTVGSVGYRKRYRVIVGSLGVISMHSSTGNKISHF